jgi:putative methionine-R-sulfoxide reductase with GAF domain
VVHREGLTYVFDVDSEKYDFFDETDARFLTEFLTLLPA